MSKFVDPSVLDGGLNAIRANANKMVLLKTYTTDYATAMGANNMCAVDMVTKTPGQTGGDYTIAPGASNSRVLTVASNKQATATQDNSAGTNDLHIGFVDTVNQVVLWVTDETSNAAFGNGAVITFPSNLQYTSSQPV